MYQRTRQSMIVTQLQFGGDVLGDSAEVFGHALADRLHGLSRDGCRQVGNLVVASSLLERRFNSVLDPATLIRETGGGHAHLQ
jgi:hypothetical protein